MFEKTAVLCFAGLFFLISCGSNHSLDPENPEESKEVVVQPSPSTTLDLSLSDASKNSNSTSEFCPEYSSSNIFRPRSGTITVGPDENWIRTIETAPDNTEIILKPGVYSLNVYAVFIGNKNITIRGETANRDDVIIRGQGYNVGSEGFMILGTDITIANLTMEEIRNHCISIKGEQGAERPHIYNVACRNIGTQMIKGSPGNDGTHDGVIACSSFGYTSSDKMKGDYINAIDLHQAIGFHIRDNYIYNFLGDGSGCEVDIDCGSYITGPAILIWNRSADTIIERNILKNNFRNIALGLTSGHTGGIVRNNSISRDLPGDAGIELQTASGTKIYQNTVLIRDYPGAIEARQSSNLEITNNRLSSSFFDRGGNSGLILEGNSVEAF